MAATAKFQHALPFALYSISPELSARHAVRARQLNPEDVQHPFVCGKCGVILLAGTRTSRGRVQAPLRSRNLGNGVESCQAATTKGYQKKCNNCGHIEPVLVDSARAHSFPSVRKRQSALAASNVVPGNLAPDFVIEEITNSTSSQSKATISPPAVQPEIIAAKASESLLSKPPNNPSRKKKKSGLQELLSRNRQQISRSTTSTTPAKLSDFLNGL